MCYGASMSPTESPDMLIIPRDDPHPSMIIEVKLSLGGLENIEHQIKRYMIRSGCPTALLVSPTLLRVYRDTFTSYDEGSILMVGEFPMAEVFGGWLASTNQAAHPGLGLQFEAAVRGWLEGLTEASSVASLPPALRDAVEVHVLPVLERGEVRVSGPRVLWKRTGS